MFERFPFFSTLRRAQASCRYSTESRVFSACPKTLIPRFPQLIDYTVPKVSGQAAHKQMFSGRADVANLVGRMPLGPAPRAVKLGAHPLASFAQSSDFEPHI